MNLAAPRIKQVAVHLAFTLRLGLTRCAGCAYPQRGIPGRNLQRGCLVIAVVALETWVTVLVAVAGGSQGVGFAFESVHISILCFREHHVNAFVSIISVILSKAWSVLA